MANAISFRPNPLTELMVDDDPSRVIRLDLADVGVLTRFHDLMPEIDALDEQVTALAAKKESGEAGMLEYAEMLADVEKKLAELINRIFNADVCTAATGGASLFTPVGGYLLYERIIDVLSGLYGEELAKQAKLRQQRIKKHTAKYGK